MRLLIGAMPQMLREIVKDLLADQAGLDVVDVSGTDADLVEATRRYQPDVVVTTLRELNSPELWERLVGIHPRLRLLTVSEDGRSAWLHGLVPQRIALHDVSPQELLAAILGWSDHEPR